MWQTANPLAWAYEHHVPYMSLYVQLFWVSRCQLLRVEALLWSPSQHPVLWVAALFPPCKEQYCPRSPVNWLITSLMRMERPVTMDTLSDGQVTSEPKTRTCLIWENGPGAGRDSWTRSCKWKGGRVINGWMSVTASDRCTVNLILYEKDMAEQLLFVCVEIGMIVRLFSHHYCQFGMKMWM